MKEHPPHDPHPEQGRLEKERELLEKIRIHYPQVQKVEYPSPEEEKEIEELSIEIDALAAERAEEEKFQSIVIERLRLIIPYLQKPFIFDAYPNTPEGHDERRGFELSMRGPALEIRNILADQKISTNQLGGAFNNLMVLPILCRAQGIEIPEGVEQIAKEAEILNTEMTENVLTSHKPVPLERKVAFINEAVDFLKKSLHAITSAYRA
jgi:hypothetical protein